MSLLLRCLAASELATAEGPQERRAPLLPLVITDQLAQSQHRIDVGPFPMHAGAF